MPPLLFTTNQEDRKAVHDTMWLNDRDLLIYNKFLQMEPLFGTNPYQQYKSLQAGVNVKFSARQMLTILASLSASSCTDKNLEFLPLHTSRLESETVIVSIANPLQYGVSFCIKFILVR